MVFEKVFNKERTQEEEEARQPGEDFASYLIKNSTGNEHSRRLIYFFSIYHIHIYIYIYICIHICFFKTPRQSGLVRFLK